MERKSITDLKEIFNDGEITKEFLNELINDDRKGVQKLIKSYEQKQHKKQLLTAQFKKMSQYENKAYANGHRFIAGIDEAGRGPLAGPVVAAAVILPRDFTLLGLNDSKQLTEAKRESFFEIIKTEAISFSVSIISNQKIDEINIFEAAKLAMRESIDGLKQSPDHILIDAVKLHGLPCTSESIVKGDAKSISIAAASILAKVTRDRLMKKLHHAYPAYNFSSNMGYGTKQHIHAIYENGITPYHRKSFAPVNKITK